jgi:hypothetical protein
MIGDYSSWRPPDLAVAGPYPEKLQEAAETYANFEPCQRGRRRRDVRSRRMISMPCCTSRRMSVQIYIRGYAART